MRQVVRSNELTAILRECWVLRSNRRLSATRPDWTDEPTAHAVVVESITVEPERRRQHHCRRLIEALCADTRFEMVVIEAVQNEHLAAALMRWGWECDPAVMDFYRATG